MSESESGVRTRLDIKKALLKRAMSGQSRYTAREMILLIQWIQSRAREIPDDHGKELDIIRAVEREQAEMRQLLLDAGFTADDLPPDSRALLRLNIEERRRGMAGKWHENGHLHTLLAQPPPTPSIN